MPVLHLRSCGSQTIRLAFVVVAIGGLAAPSTAAADVPAASAKLKDLLKERVAAAREVGAMVKERFKNGHATIEQMHDAARLLYDAELDACETLKDRVAVLEKLVAAAKELEEYAAQRAKTGLGTPDSALVAKAERLKAEIALERERAKGTDKAK